MLANFLKVKKVLSQQKLDLILILDDHNRYWLTGFPSSAGFLVATFDKIFLFLDGRYQTAAQNKMQNSSHIEIILITNNNNTSFYVNQLMHQISADPHNLKVGFDGHLMSFNTYQELQKEINQLVNVDLSALRMIKSPQEIEYITTAVRLADRSLKAILPIIKPGIKELAVRQHLITAFFKNGTQGESFPTIVASGKNGSLPHAVAGNKKIVNHELLTIDFGCYYQGYASDITRTFQIGTVSPELLRMFKVVAQAQEKGIQQIRPGVKLKTIAVACRSVITAAGYPQYKHGTGHGVGVEVHEKPYVSELREDELLQPGMVITVEPGIYLPDLGGVRIEDDVLVTNDGYRVLSQLPRYRPGYLPLTLEYLINN